MASENNKILIGILTVSLLALIVYFISSCGCKTSESYRNEYSGLSGNSSYLYRSYAETPEEKENVKDRCKSCKGYNKSYETYEPYEDVKNIQPNINDFKLCPHNERKYGVAVCNSQGKIM
jgi:hypothetical protein